MVIIGFLEFYHCLPQSFPHCWVTKAEKTTVQG